MTSSFMASTSTRKIRLFRNGDENFLGKTLVLNPRHIRSFDRFLETVTSHVGFGQAVRSIRTPRHGTIVQSLDDLEDQQDYVAVGIGRFRNIGYGTLPDRHARKLRDVRNVKKDINSENIRVVEHSRLRVSSRIRRSTFDGTPIYVYCNGDEMTPARKITLTYRLMQSWQTILAEINRYINPQNTATRFLCTTDGELVKHKSELQSGGYYVAVGFGAHFRPLDYGLHCKPAFNASPRFTPKNPSSLMMNGFPGGSRSQLAMRSRGLDERSSTESSSLPPLSTHSDPVFIPQKIPTIRHRRALAFNGRQVYPLRPMNRLPAQYRPQRVDYDRDDGGMFKSRTRRVETRGAAEVRDSRETSTDLPLDFVRAQQVEEEEEDDEEGDWNKSPTNGTIIEENDDDFYDEGETVYDAPRRRTVDSCVSDDDEPPSCTFRDYDDVDHEAAVKIQSNYRGYRTRMHLADRQY